jgi:hypothetical protein
MELGGVEPPTTTGVRQAEYASSAPR